MKDNTKKILVWSTIVAVLGVGGYFGYKAYKKKKEEKKAKEEQDRLELLSLTTTSNQGSDNAVDNISTATVANPFKNTNEVKAFQDWLDKNHPLWINDNGKWKNLRVGTASEPNRHINGAGYGNFGKQTASAYSRWGAEYSQNVSSVATATSIPEVFKVLMNRLGNRISYVKRGSMYVCQLFWNNSGKIYEFTFFDNQRFFVQDAEGNTLFKGDYSDGARKLYVSEDNYSRISKIGNTYTGDTFFDTGKKLFTDKKA